MNTRTDSATCPKCGFEFSKLYARVVSCKGCPMFTSSCSIGKIKCPTCGHEFSV